MDPQSVKVEGAHVKETRSAVVGKRREAEDTESSAHMSKAVKPSSPPSPSAEQNWVGTHGNPLRNKEALQKGVRAVAQRLRRGMDDGQKATRVSAMEFCLEVIQNELGLKEYAVGQYERILISSMRKQELGSEDRKYIGKSQPKPTVSLPEVSDQAEEGKVGVEEAEAMIPSVDDLRARLKGMLDGEGLLSRGAVSFDLLSEKEAAALATLVAAPRVTGRETPLRASMGNGQNGAYAIVERRPAALARVEQALGAQLRDEFNVETLGTRSIVLKYTAGGVNFAHQDQCDKPFQAMVMLSNPGEDFSAGQFYVSDPGCVEAGTQVEWSRAGQCVVFCANAASSSGHNYYHGMRPVREGSRSPCIRISLGLFQ
mmetsp:Transcript_48328/g.104690  ORF Transcript_48328/g.104690 Transcript_48328/m.104690 type:complete len:371 (+) Transcript_48328:254-1366(+)